jgi:hypothetical protein
MSQACEFASQDSRGLAGDEAGGRVVGSVFLGRELPDATKVKTPS